jgi:hypothetical protein
MRPDPQLIATPDDFARALQELRGGSGLSLRALAADLRRLSDHFGCLPARTLSAQLPDEADPVPLET